MKVLIVGGGVGGLTMCRLLLAQGQTVVCLDSKKDLTGNGFAVGIWRSGLQVLQELAVDIAKLGVPSSYHEVRTHQNRLLYNKPMSAGEIVFISRSALIGELQSQCRDVQFKLGQSLQHMEQNQNRVAVTFDDGTQGEFDLVIGADGIRSQIRKYLGNQAALVAFSGSLAAFEIFEITGKARVGSIEYLGSGKLVGMYPTRQGLGVFCGTRMDGWQPDCLDDVREHFQEFQLPWLDGVGEGDISNIYCDGFFDVVADNWFAGRVVLIGDAAHGFLPTSGYGTSMALKGAATLARSLQTYPQLHQALAHYTHTLRAEVAMVRRKSRLVAWMMKRQGRFQTGMRNYLLAAARKIA